jgi:glycosyltransferase involved in cell wall biosynthesis
MRFVYVVSQYPARSETFIAREMQELVDAGHEVDILRMRWSDTRDGLRVTGARVSPVLIGPRALTRGLSHALGNRPWHAVRILKTLLGSETRLGIRVRLLGVWLAMLSGRAWLNGRSVDHIRAHLVDMEAAGAWCLSQITDRPFSITAQTTTCRLGETLMRRIVRAASVGVATTDQTSRWLRRTRTDGPVITVRSGLPLAEVQQQVPDRPGETYRVLAVGRLIPKKGFDLLVKACSRLLRSEVDLRLDVYGDGPERDRLETMASRSAAPDRIRLHGAVSYDTVRGAYQNADVLVMPSRHDTETDDRDGLPNVLIEAAAAMCPVIGTPIGGITDLVRDGETGLIVAPEDVDALVQGLRNVLGAYDVALRRAARARQVVEDRYCLETEVHRLVTAVQHVVDDAQPAA